MDVYENELVQANSLGVFKMAHLIYEYEALKAAAEYCTHTKSLAEATLIVEKAKKMLGSVSVQLDDDGLEEEYLLMDQLLKNLAVGKTACASADTVSYH